jgi:hypothetical protein
LENFVQTDKTRLPVIQLNFGGNSAAADSAGDHDEDVSLWSNTQLMPRPLAEGHHPGQFFKCCKNAKKSFISLFLDFIFTFSVLILFHYYLRLGKNSQFVKILI